jgi:hypothetical protein
MGPTYLEASERSSACECSGGECTDHGHHAKERDSHWTGPQWVLGYHCLVADSMATASFLLAAFAFHEHENRPDVYVGRLH